MSWSDAKSKNWIYWGGYSKPQHSSNWLAGVPGWLDFLNCSFSSWKCVGLQGWYPSVISPANHLGASSSDASLLGSVDSLSRAWRLQERGKDVFLDCNPKVAWVGESFASGGASLGDTLHCTLTPALFTLREVMGKSTWSVSPFSSNPSLSLYSISASQRTVWCPLLYSKHLFLSALFLIIAFFLYLSVSCHFSLFLCLSPHSQFQVWVLLFFLGAGMPQPSLHCLPLHLVKCTGCDSIQLLFTLRWWGFYGFLKVVARKNFHHRHNLGPSDMWKPFSAQSRQSDLKASF